MGAGQVHQSNWRFDKSGTFVLDYRGEIMLQMPDDKAAPEPWNDDMATCYVDGRSKVESGADLVDLEPPAATAPRIG